MTSPLKDGEYFHICLKRNYVRHKPLEVGDTFTVGDKHNPFYTFYETPRSYSVKTDKGSVDVPAMTFLREIHRGQINCPDLAKQALAIANHYNILARELLMEEVRLQFAPDAPSRRKCMWVVDDLGLAQYWQKKLHGNSYIVRLHLEGDFHRGDATLLMNDSEPISNTYEKAERYWKGETTDDPLPEILFTGVGAVLEDHVGEDN